MFLSLHDRMEKKNSGSAFMDKLLPLLVQAQGREFNRFADCGAGVGNTALSYGMLFDKADCGAARDGAKIHCFEPLPENFLQIERRLSGCPIFELHQRAVSNETGQAQFCVPSRLAQDAAGHWKTGTSYAGHLGRVDSQETIDVATVRLDQIDGGRFDFVKADLQGGELNALLGLGSKLSDVKVVYVEMQLLKDNSRLLTLLRDAGFSLYYDQLQFGLTDPGPYVELGAIRNVGLSVTRMRRDIGDGLPLIMWGHFHSLGERIVDSSGALTDSAHAAFRCAKIQYLQTDVIAVHSRICDLFTELLADLK